MKLFILTVVLLFIAGSLGAPAEVDPCLRACQMIWRPLCGDNGVTYANECTMESLICMQKLEVNVAHDGACDTMLTTAP
ncbi:hypothetical protein SNE40_003982 [Patella caerulea]|uniref:Kazal-like domain-containing protein n=1 Tax=Patella caerulea TaxID=87958 RepID=A0AAN8K940_PATCE